MNKGKLPLPGEDIETEMFTMLIEQMESKGRKRYEISNFATQVTNQSIISSTGKMQRTLVLVLAHMAM